MKTRRMSKPASTAIVAAVALALSAPLYASSDTPASDKPSPAFQRLDTDRDGYLRRDEAARLRNFSKAFDEADDNHDGMLDQDEFVKAESIYDRMRAKAYIADSVITAKVKAALVKAPDVIALDVRVKTDYGVVLLSGFVDDESQARRAREIAASIQGVKNVRSSLLVKS